MLQDWFRHVLATAIRSSRNFRRRSRRRLHATEPVLVRITERLESRLMLSAATSDEHAITLDTSVSDVAIQLLPVADGLAGPVSLKSAGDGSGRRFIVEQIGRIRLLDASGNLSTFLDLTAQVQTGGERGLLGLAFHPNFAVVGATGEGRFYVYYSAPSIFGGDHDTVVSEFRVSALNPNLADPLSERVLLRFAQPFSNHNAGDLAFGPQDGQLYISTGDGGGAGDPFNAAQDTSNLFGNILRIDPLGTNGPTGTYGIPLDNPFVGIPGIRPEIFAFGFRNPYRFSFDAGPEGTGQRLFVADVGQDSWEEVNLVVSGGNYGWRIREGAHPFNTSDPQFGVLIDPIAEYFHPPNGTRSVIGGFVYRGIEYPQLQGKYLFADLSGILFALEEQPDGSWTRHQLNVVGGNPIGEPIIGFGEDVVGGLYVLTTTRVLSIELASGVPPLSTEVLAYDASSGLWRGALSNTADFSISDFALAAANWRDVFQGDVNGDGQPDAIGFTEDGRWFVGLSNGTNLTFFPWAQWSAGSGWAYLAVADFNGDQRDDIVGMGTNGLWYVGLSDGLGSFVTGAFWAQWSVADSWSDLEIGDFNVDQRADVAGFGFNGLWFVGLSNGAGTLVTGSAWAQWSIPGSWATLEIADFNQDGRDDIAGMGYNGTWFVGLSNGGGNFVTGSSWAQWSIAESWLQILVGDFNADGRADIFGLGFNGQIFVGLSNGLGEFQSFATWGAVTPSAVAEVRFADVNRDLRQDLLLREPGSGDWSFLESTGSSFTLRPGFSFGAGTWVPLQPNEYSRLQKVFLNDQADALL